ncbi:MAG: amino acid permease [Candidatus Cloacimonetes bacterium]|nr:amino acid permease [Candidatus Cloacimonadota bacterium]
MKLKKELTFKHVFSIAAGAMISSGIFILPGLAFQQVGPAIFISYFLAGIMALLGVLSVIELSTAMPKAGGDYYFVNRSMGPLAGTVSGIFGWLAISLKSAFAIFGLSEVIFLLTGSPLIVNSFILTSGFVILNIAGVKEAARLELWLVGGLLLILTAYTLLGFSHISYAHYTPLLPYGKNSLLITAGFVFVSFGGLISVASVAEEVKNPGRNIPLGLITAVVAVSIIYFILLFVTVGVLPAEKLAGSFTPLADAAKIFSGKIGYIIISIAAVLAFVTTAIAGILSASRYPLALSRDKLLPALFGKVDKKRQTPVISLLVTGTFIFITLLLPLEILVKAASTVILSANIMANVAVIILRESKIRNYQPTFKTPLYPWLQIFTILLLGFFVVDMGLATIEISLGFFIFSIIIYLLFGRRFAKTEYAFLHIMARVVNRKIVSSALETELRDIILQRDDIEHDEFDNVVLESMAFENVMADTKDELFSFLAEQLTSKFQLEKEAIVSLLNQRESEGSTALTDFTALPHIVLEESDRFHLILVRSKTGIFFSKENPKVKAVFMIIGSLNKRRLHLKALAAIAQILHNDDFRTNWLNAQTSQQLRDFILLSDRKR